MPSASALDNAALKLLSEGLSLETAQKRARPWLERVGLGRARRTHAARAVEGRVPTGRDRARARERTADAARRRADGQPRLPSQPGDPVADAGMCDERRIPVLLVTHDREALAYVDRVYTLRDGALARGWTRRRPGRRADEAHLFGIRVGVLGRFYRWRLREHGAQELLAAAGIAVGVALVSACSSRTRA